MDFIQRAKNQLKKLIPEPTKACQDIGVIHVETEPPDYHLELIMDGQKAVGYLNGYKSK